MMACNLVKLASVLALGGVLWACSDTSPTAATDRRVNPIQGNGGQNPPNGGPGGGPGLMAIDVDNPSEAMPPPPPPPKMEEACGNAMLHTERVLPSVMILLDGSQSMQMLYGDPPVDDAGMPTGTQLTRWQAAREALINPTDGVVVQLQDLVRFGVAVYGTNPTCPLPITPIDPELNNYQAIANAVPMAPPGLTTPTGPALDAIVQRLPDPSLALDITIGPQIIILATDGDPNDCITDPFQAFGLMTNYGPSIQAAKNAQAKNQRIYVVSVGQDAAGQHLQEMANLGAGMDQFANPGADVYYPEDPSALAATLANLIGDELSCDVALEGDGVMEQYRCNGQVFMTVGDDRRELECDGPDGWKLIDPTHIALQGEACEIYKGAIDARLEANFPCEFLVK